MTLPNSVVQRLRFNAANLNRQFQYKCNAICLETVSETRELVIMCTAG